MWRASTCGALGKIANCQVATTVALWTGTRAWFLGARLYLPEGWLTPSQRARARIPAPVRFQEKWRQALALLRQVRAAGFDLTGVVGDAEFGDVTVLRAALHRLRLPYALGISSDLTVFLRPADRRPVLRRRSRLDTRPRPRSAAGGAGGGAGLSGRGVARDQLAQRDAAATPRPVPRPAGDAGAQAPARQLAPEIWLLCERETGANRLKYYFIHLPATASLRQLVVFAHQRWAIEQQYQELKSELGLDHFEGRSYPGWQHHVVLTAVAHAYIQCERRRRGAATLTFPAVRAIVQEIFTALLFAAKPRYMQWMEQAKRNLQLRI